MSCIKNLQASLHNTYFLAECPSCSSAAVGESEGDPSTRFMSCPKCGQSLLNWVFLKESGDLDVLCNRLLSFFSPETKLLNEFLLDENGGEDDQKIEQFTEELLRYQFPEDDTSPKKALFKSFYKTSVYYLLAFCFPEDLTLRSIELIAKTLDEPFKHVHLEYTCFYFMLEKKISDENVTAAPSLVSKCIDAYKEFSVHYIHEMENSSFSDDVQKAIQGYIHLHFDGDTDLQNKFVRAYQVLSNTLSELDAILSED